MTTKTLFWETNYNNKLDCNAFLHIDLAPAALPIRSKVEQTEFIIETKDSSHTPVITEIYDYSFFPVKNITDCLALASHGMITTNLIRELEKKYSKELLEQRGVGLYFYIKKDNR
jgi:phosphoribosyl-ATP pyrophosphohydrolase